MSLVNGFFFSPIDAQQERGLNNSVGIVILWPQQIILVKYYSSCSKTTERITMTCGAYGT